MTASDLLRALGPVVDALEAIHLETMFKIDVFAAKRRPYDLEALKRARPQPLENATPGRSFPVASPEDTILAELEWFRAGGEVSDRQWTDVVGVLKTRSGAIDYGYLERWAVSLGVQDLLDRARRQASA